jgi:putative ABC transport system substrate-binding protein
MKRRDFITVLGGAAAWPVAARAQQAVPIIGFLSATSSAQWTPYVDAFTQGLNETGYRVSQNVAVEYRWANGQYNLLPGLAAEFVRMRVGVIIAVAPPAALAAKAATSTVPIVFSSGLDPVRLGLVTSYNKPGGNVTGVNFFTAELGPKALEILLEVTPNIKSIGFLANPDNANTASQLADLNTASAKRGYQLQAYYANSPETIENAFKLWLNKSAQLSSRPTHSLSVEGASSSASQSSLRFRRYIICESIRRRAA